MVVLIIFTLLLGIIFGLFLASLSLWLIKVNCPQCKQPKTLKEIILFRWKERIIVGKPCQHCQRPRPQIDIEL